MTVAIRKVRKRSPRAGQGTCWSTSCDGGDGKSHAVNKSLCNEHCPMPATCLSHQEVVTLNSYFVNMGLLEHLSAGPGSELELLWFTPWNWGRSPSSVHLCVELTVVPTS